MICAFDMFKNQVGSYLNREPEQMRRSPENVAMLNQMLGRFTRELELRLKDTENDKTLADVYGGAILKLKANIRNIKMDISALY